jgi:hypothetical protein
VALGKECITEVRTDKTGSTGDENAHGGKSNGVGVDLWLPGGERGGQVLRAR